MVWGDRGKGLTEVQIDNMRSSSLISQRKTFYLSEDLGLSKRLLYMLSMTPYGTVAAPAPPATGTAAAPDNSVTSTAVQTRNQPVSVSVAPIHKKKSWKRKSARLEREDEGAEPSQGEEEEEEELINETETT
ncbi:hypothetical protein QYF61_025720 [Mycteria americana]|uniref:Uncharacterized protein n=1 Tax=Mycteria americana TaxID=33587 RepID=A0AAN7RYD7_MYCAM|nr:hypothetical protein QYF61_025720 [Mycteria americana]